MNRLDLEGKRAVVTGAGAGLGLAIAERLTASGARVALWDRDAATLARAAATLSPASEAITVDVSSEHAIAAGLEKTVAQLGGIDVLVNNAGISGPNMTTWEYPVEDWRRVVDVNLTGVFLAAGRWSRTWWRAATAASSTSPRLPARRATRMHPPTARARRGSLR